MNAELGRLAIHLLPELLLCAGVFLIILWGLLYPRRSSANLSLLCLLVLAVALFALFRQLVTEPGGAVGMLAPGTFGAVFRVMIVLAASITVLLSHEYLLPAGLSPSDYYLLILLGTLGMMITAGAGNLLLLFLGFELMSLSFVLLAGLIPGSERSKEAALKYLLYGLAASALLLYGLSVLYGRWGSWDLGVITARAAAGNGGPAVALAMMLILAGFGFKIGLVPFHLWIPDVYEGSPPPAAAFLSVGPKVASLGAAAILFVGALGDLAGVWHPVLWGMAVLSMVWGNVAALAQRNLKRMLAYSSIAHVGYLAIGLLAAVRQPNEGLTGLGFYLFTYVFFNLGAFALVIWLEGPGGRGPLLEDVAGLGRRQPWMGAGFTVCFLALAGIPPTAGFMAKLWVFLAAVHAGMTALAVIGVLASVLGAFYYLRVVWYLYFKEPEEGSEGRRVPLNIGAFGLLLCVAATVWFGVWPGPLLELLRRAVESTFLAP